MRRIATVLVFALTAGFSLPALADVAPPREQEEPPAETPPAETPPAETPPAETPPADDGGEKTPPADADTKDADADAKKGTKSEQGGLCSIAATPDDALIGLCALVLAISGLALRRRS